MRKNILKSNGFHFHLDLFTLILHTDFAANDTFLEFKLEVIDPNQVIEKAKEQLCRAMEVKEEEDMQRWMEKRWEEWMLEWDLVVGLVDRDLVREEGKHAMV